MLTPATQALEQAQAYQATETGANQAAQAGLTEQQEAYNKQLDAFNESAQTLITSNNNKQKAQIATLQAQLNDNENLKNEEEASESAGAYGWTLNIPILGKTINNDANSNINNTIASEQSQLNQLKSNILPNTL
jgi:organic radical activating enzyme